MFVSGTCKGEICSFAGCTDPAAAKVGEEIAHDDPFPNRHNLTAYVCEDHFRKLMGWGVDWTDEHRPATPEPGAESDRTRRIDWRTMSMKLGDALGRYMQNPAAGEREWAEKMLFRWQEMIDNERAGGKARDE